ncbi:MAG TPA: hypothetical protein VIY86_09845 [Pirellulaceae bacterium]
MKFLSPKIHGILDYLVIIVLFSAPNLLGFTGNAASVSYILGAAYVLLALTTAYPLSLAKIIPFTVHGTLELILSPFLVAMPWLAGFSGQPAAKTFFIASGVALFVVWMVTDYKAADIAYGKRGGRLSTGAPRTA